MRPEKVMIDMKVRVRPARKKDYDDVKRITAAAYVGAGFVDADDQSYLPVLTNIARRAQHALLWIAEVDRSIKGAVTVGEPGSEYAEIAAAGELEFRMLAVDPDVQRGGIGRALVQAVVEHAQALEAINAVVLSSEESMTGAHRLYASMGFERVPERDWTVDGYDIRLLVFRLAL
ncbi:GNAT family N-acetyltransferase [Arthrobacter monumenti]